MQNPTLERHLPLDGAMNFRDFGGYRGAVGNVRWGVVYRADALANLSERDFSQLVDSRAIRTVVELCSFTCPPRDPIHSCSTAQAVVTGQAWQPPFSCSRLALVASRSSRITSSATISSSARLSDGALLFSKKASIPPQSSKTCDCDRSICYRHWTLSRANSAG